MVRINIRNCNKRNRRRQEHNKTVPSEIKEEIYKNNKLRNFFQGVKYERKGYQEKTILNNGKNWEII